MNLKISFLMLCCTVTGLLAQPRNLSFKIGVPLSHVQVLLKARTLGKMTVVPTAALGYFSMNFYENESDDYFTNNDEITIHLFIPKVGVRLLGDRYGDLRKYTLVEAIYVLPVVYGSALKTDKDKKELRDALDLMGLALGFGAEYFFSDQFSMGGEASINLTYHTARSTGSYASYKSEVRTILSALLTNVTLNYYFRE